MDLTPFSVDGTQVEALGSSFAAFVNRLLQAERASLGMPGGLLTVTVRENDPDGGVDAEFRDCPGSAWVPEGGSAWQFKRSDIPPAECRTEAKKPEVQRVLQEGGSYCLAIGDSLTPRKRRSREKAVEEEVGDPGRVKVLTASGLAEWASEHPAVLTFPELRANTGPLIRYEEWSVREVHRTVWVTDDARDAMISAVRQELLDGGSAVRFEGGGGVGKTRLALEILRDERLAPIAGYVDDAAGLDGAVFNYIQRTGRTAVLVADECDRRTHQRLVDRLTGDGKLRLLTIGQESELEGWGPTFYEIPSMARDDLGEVLSANFPGMPRPHADFVVENSGGSVRLALELARRLADLGEADAAAILGGGDIEAVLKLTLPSGPPFVVASALATLRRVGWEGGKEADLKAIADYLGETESGVRFHAEALSSAGLLARQGRYRYITPRPLAVVLAARRWGADGERITNELLPSLGDDGQDALVARAADLGRHPSASSALEVLLAPAGPFGSLEALEQGTRARLLSYLSVISPHQTLALLEDLTDRPRGELERFRSSRRQLVWALEKLAWHSSTFERAADVLLRLALAENESYANSATGTWVALFGTRLPGTAASPQQRVSYLRRLAEAEGSATQALVAQGAARGMAIDETRTVSAERQYGRAVEPAGVPVTFDEDRDYRLAIADLLCQLARSGDREVSRPASDALLRALRSFIDTVLEEEVVNRVLEAVPREDVRREALHLLRIHERREREAPSGVRRLLEATESSDTLATIMDVLSAPPWDVETPGASKTIGPLLRTINQEGRLPELISWLSSDAAKSAWFAGQELATDEGWRAHLALLLATEPMPIDALGGFVSETASNRANSLDAVLHAAESKVEPARYAWLLALSGATAVSRLVDLFESGRVQPGDVAPLHLRGVLRDAEQGQLQRLLRVLVDQSHSAMDWSTVLELVGWATRDSTLPEEVRRSLAWEVFEGYPADDLDRGHARWEWADLGEQLVDGDPVRVVEVILANVHAGMFLSQHDHEADVLLEASRRAPERTLNLLIEAIQGPDGYRLTVGGRGWLLGGIPLQTITDWIGADRDRARLVAGVASPGGNEPSPLARFLLETFAPDDEIEGGLAMQYMSGVWSGPESSHLNGQIKALDGWRSEEPKVRAWAERLQGHFRERRTIALRDEVEGPW